MIEGSGTVLDLDPDPGGQKTYRAYGPGSATMGLGDGSFVLPSL
jgi:hypothetical protein